MFRYAGAMAKPKKRYVCQLCGSVSPRWTGQCIDCGEWNSLVEDAGGVVTPFSAKHNLRGGGRRKLHRLGQRQHLRLRQSPRGRDRDLHRHGGFEMIV